MKLFTCSILFLHILISLFSVPVEAQSKLPAAAITGALTDPGGKAVDFATVSLLNAKDSTVLKGTLTDNAGFFTFNNIKTGSYLIKAASVGFENAFSGVVIIDGGNTLISIPVLKMQVSTRALKMVTVTATRPLIEHKAGKTVMNVENSVLAAGNSAMEILARAPGVSVDKDDNISLKGKSGIAVMINDKLTYLSPGQLATLLKSTDGAAIKSIEINDNPSAKYDAAGNAGIINIKLKQNDKQGTNGTITAGIGYGNFWKDRSNFSISHKEGKLNVFASFSHDDLKKKFSADLKRIVTDSMLHQTFFNQLSAINTSDHDNAYRFGTAYDISSANTIGFEINGYFNSTGDRGNNYTYIGNEPQNFTSYQTTRSVYDQSFHNFGLNLNDRIKIDTSGQSLSVDADYAHFRNNGNAQYNTFFYQPDGSTGAAPDFLREQTPSEITIHAAKADYALPLKNNISLEAGVKYSDVKTDNTLSAQRMGSSGYENVPELGNQFVYTEKIAAGYLSLNKVFTKTSIQLGLRAENTSSTGNLVTSNNVVRRRYLNLFPNLSVTEKLNAKSDLSLSYSRRIDRPGYDALNPFVYYMDRYTYQQGNPFLRPQFTNKIAVEYTYNKMINVSLGYSRTSDVISSILLTNTVNKATYQTTLNLDNQNYYDLNINTPYTVSRWWTGNLNATVYYQRLKSDTLLKGRLDQGQYAFQGNATQVIKLLKGYKAEFTTIYHSSGTFGIYHINDHFAQDGGISHSFANNLASVKISVSDIFNSLRDNVSSNYQSNNLTIRQKNETRIARLTFTYNFGNKLIRQRNHEGSVSDEKDRVKGVN